MSTKIEATIERSLTACRKTASGNSQWRTCAHVPDRRSDPAVLRVKIYISLHDYERRDERRVCLSDNVWFL